MKRIKDMNNLISTIFNLPGFNKGMRIVSQVKYFTCFGHGGFNKEFHDPSQIEVFT